MFGEFADQKLHAEQNEQYLAQFLVELRSQRAHTSLDQDLNDLAAIDIPDNALLHEALFTMCKSKLF